MTPATKAPMACDKPASSISNAEPNTTNKAAAVITSRALAFAKIRNTGFKMKRPISTRIANATKAIVADSHQEMVLSVSSGER